MNNKKQVTKISISSKKPEIDQCIIYGEPHIINSIYVDDLNCYYNIYSPYILNDDEMTDIINSDDYIEMYF